MSLKSILILLLIALPLLLVSMIYAGADKNFKYGQVRKISVDSTGTNSISWEVGNGSGAGEEILSETLTSLDHLEDFYSLYIGFIGVSFEQDSGEVHQSRYTNLQFNVDGELTSSDTMVFLEMLGDIRLAQGTMIDNTIGAADTANGPFSLEIVQKSYVRPSSEDNFAILEYHLNNLDSVFTLTNCKVLFFCDFDVGDAIFDNLTGRDDANKMLYQYSLDDYYAGFALLTPESEPCYYGNYNNWFLDGTDAEVDSVVAIPTYEDSLEIIPGDHSCYMVVEMGELPALTSKTVAFAFAVNEDLPSLQNSIMQAKELYVEYINTISTYPVAREYSLFLAYPNPFNVNIIINLDLTQASGGELTVFNVLGKPVSTIYRGYLNSGGHKFEWNGMDANGIRVSAGVYYLSSHFSNTNEIRKIVFLP